jgi:hypothetical protein
MICDHGRCQDLCREKDSFPRETARKFPYKLRFNPTNIICIVCPMSEWNKNFIMILNFGINIGIFSHLQNFYSSPKIQGREADVFGSLNWAVPMALTPYKNNDGSNLYSFRQMNM